MLWLQ